MGKIINYNDIVHFAKRKVTFEGTEWRTSLSTNQARLGHLDIGWRKKDILDKI